MTMINDSSPFELGAVGKRTPVEAAMVGAKSGSTFAREAVPSCSPQYPVPANRGFAPSNQYLTIGASILAYSTQRVTIVSVGSRRTRRFLLFTSTIVASRLRGLR